MVQAGVLDDVAASVSVTRRIQPTYGYYRQPNGWITVSPITRMERIKYEERGWTYLGQYGAFDMTAYGANHPLEALFMFGGAKELPVEQVIQMGFYFDSPLVPTCKQHLTQFHRTHNANCWHGAKPAEFPQMAGISADRLGPFPCEFCSRKLPTVQAKEQHQSVAHKEQLGNIQQGKSLGVSLGQVLAHTAVPAPTESQEMQEMKATIARLEAMVRKQAKSNPRSRSKRKV